MPALLGGTNRGAMPLEALLAAYAGSLNVVGNFVAKTMDFELQRWDFTIWAEFDPSGMYGLAKVTKPILVVHVEARVTTPESGPRLAQLRNVMAVRDPIHNLLQSAGVRIEEKWERITPGGTKIKSRKNHKRTMASRSKTARAIVPVVIDIVVTPLFSSIEI